MNNDKIFYHPETGELMHRVPVGATIPARMPCGYIDADGTRHFGALPYDAEVKSYSRPHFTAEPIPRQVPLEFGFTFRIIGGFHDGKRAVVADPSDQYCPFVAEGGQWVSAAEVSGWEPITNDEEN